MAISSNHQSVLREEVVNYLAIKNGASYLDCTFGGGGHSRAILEANDSVDVVGLDRDSSTAAMATALAKQFPKRFHFEPLSYRRLDELEQSFDGILFDLGLSTDQLDVSGRGFSFRSNEPLDMRFDATTGQTAAMVLNTASIHRLEAILRDYAQDRHWRGLAARIVTRRREQPFRTTSDLIEVVGNGSPAVLAPIFQALRIAVNDELETLTIGLEKAKQALRPNGRLVVISFHSLEDRIVKHFMRQEAFEILTKKPISPSEEEVQRNSRARSAKLRAVQLRS